jgi:hypothetical protein
VVTEVGPDHQDEAHDLAREHAAKVAADVEEQRAEQEVADVSDGIVISPPPRPRSQVHDELGDRFEQYEANMRTQAKVVYRELQQGPVVIRPDLSQVIVWMRKKGVKIKAVSSMEGSFYQLVTPPPTE